MGCVVPSATTTWTDWVVADDPNALVVGTNRIFRAHVRIVPRDSYTEIHVHPGGLVWDRLINTFGIARKVRDVLREASELGGSK